MPSTVIWVIRQLLKNIESIALNRRPAIRTDITQSSSPSLTRNKRISMLAKKKPVSTKKELRKLLSAKHCLSSKTISDFIHQKSNSRRCIFQRIPAEMIKASSPGKLFLLAVCFRMIALPSKNKLGFHS